MSLPEAAQAIANDSHSRIFVFDDWVSKQNFWKQFLSGIFIVIVMTGLDQDMMQKNLTCKTLREAQKDMCTYGFAFVPANLLFLSLGVLLMMYFNSIGQALPDVPDNLMLQAVAGGQLGTLVVILFTIGIVAACFSSADSALTALTTTYCVDICNRPKDEKLPQTGTYRCVHCVYFVYPYLPLCQLNKFDRCYLHDSFLYIRSTLGAFCIWLMYQTSSK